MSVATDPLVQALEATFARVPKEYRGSIPVWGARIPSVLPTCGDRRSAWNCRVVLDSRSLQPPARPPYRGSSRCLNQHCTLTSKPTPAHDFSHPVFPLASFGRVENEHSKCPVLSDPRANKNAIEIRLVEGRVGSRHSPQRLHITYSHPGSPPMHESQPVVTDNGWDKSGTAGRVIAMRSEGVTLGLVLEAPSPQRSMSARLPIPGCRCAC